MFMLGGQLAVNKHALTNSYRRISVKMCQKSNTPNGLLSHTFGETE